MKLKEIRNENNNFQTLLYNQKILAEELLKEKRERLTRLEKELSDSKSAFLNSVSSNSLVKSNNNSHSGSYYCNRCAQYYNSCSHHKNTEENNKDNQYYLEVALTCKEFLLQDKCNELAEKLLKDSFEKMKNNNTKTIFDLVEKIHDCQESMQILEQNITNAELKMEELQISQETFIEVS